MLITLEPFSAPVYWSYVPALVRLWHYVALRLVAYQKSGVSRVLRPGEGLTPLKLHDTLFYIDLPCFRYVGSSAAARHLYCSSFTDSESTVTTVELDKPANIRTTVSAFLVDCITLPLAVIQLQCTIIRTQVVMVSGPRIDPSFSA